MRRSSELTLAVCAGLMAAAGCAAVRPPMPQPAAQREAPPLAPGASPRIVLGPYVQPAGQDMSTSLRLVWWSDVPGRGALDWRAPASGAAGGTSGAEQRTYQGWVRHVARVDRRGDTPSVQFTASVTANGARHAGPLRTARFLPGQGQALRFAALGDTGAGTEAERRVVEQVRKANPHLLLITGDDVYDSGNWDEYQRRFFPYFGALMADIPIIPALGNHDVGNPAHMGEPFRMVWTPPQNWTAPSGATGPYALTRRRANRSDGPVPVGQESGRNYSVDAGDCHFLCLDSTADRETLRDLVMPWARQDLADAKRRGRKWLIAYWHHPPYTRGGYKDNALQWQDIRDLFVPVLREAGAQLVLNGHDHNYQHMEKDGIHYVITGAGGARLYKVDPKYDRNDQPPLLGYNDANHSFTLVDQSADGNTLAVRQIDDTGREIDRFQLTLR